ncbi:MAG: ABC transporter permease [Ferruginibacter sp.]|nr:ABC transporter permease [Cytophagales bacterium]
MLRNHFKIAWRNLTRNRVYSVINIFGLATGMAVAILIGLWLYDEFSYDTHHQNYDRIAQVMQNQTFDGEVRTWDNQAMQLGPELRDSYGNHFKYIVMASGTNDHILSAGEKRLNKSGAYMEPQVPDLLTLKMLKGTRAGLNDPSSILLSESVAQSFFGDADPVGALMKIDNKLIVKVTGVYEDLPRNSSFADLTFIAPWELLIKSEEFDKKLTWGNSWFQTFVQVTDQADIGNVSAAIKYAKLNRLRKEKTDDVRSKPELFLHPMSRWHLYGEFKNGVNVGGRIQYVWMYGTIGVFVLLLACINFMNLSTARSEKRAKEVGIRKVVGSARSQLISQFFTESIVVALLAFALSLLLVPLALPLFNETADKKMEMLWANPWFWLTGIGFSLITGLIAGSYPALYLSSFVPVKVLKGTFRLGRLAALPRKALVVVQFTVSITLIIGTVIVFRQIQFTKNRPVGYSRNGLLTIPMQTEEVRQGYEALRNDLLGTGAVVELSQSESPVTNAGITNGGFEWRGKAPGMQDEQVTVGVTHEFGKTVDWKIKEGRDFSRAFATDSSGFILNEAAVKYMGFDQPLGEQVKAFGRTYTVIGVVKNMVMQSPYEAVGPIIFYIDAFKRTNFINVKINPRTSVSEALATIGTVFKQHNPTTPFEFKFADDAYAAKFRSEEQVGRLARYFSGLAIFISCLGLFGLASFTAEQRTKEIGVRKVLGATVINLVTLLSGDFLKLVLVALLIATPLAWYFLSGWLQAYAYRTDLAWSVFALSGLGAVGIALLTVSFQSVKAARMNPVKSLRTE